MLPCPLASPEGGEQLTPNLNTRFFLQGVQDPGVVFLRFRLTPLAELAVGGEWTRPWGASSKTMRRGAMGTLLQDFLQGGEGLLMGDNSKTCTALLCMQSLKTWLGVLRRSSSRLLPAPRLVPSVAVGDAICDVQKRRPDLEVQGRR